MRPSFSARAGSNPAPRAMDYEPSTDRSLSAEANRDIENSLIATTPACNAAENVKAIEAIVEKLKR